MTLDNQPAFIQVGKRVPRIVGSTINQVGQQNNIVLENVGLILGVTPRISPDGRVVMEVDAEKSELGSVDEGIPVSTSGGIVIKSPTISLATAQTTVSAINGETIVIGGLITKSTQTLDRRVPWLADVPLLGTLFRYSSHNKKRSELLIILTPHVIRSPEDAERIKQVESARMHWCLGDVNEIHGAPALGVNTEHPSVQVVYPDINPRGVAPKPPQRNGEMLNGAPPARPEAIPPGHELYVPEPPGGQPPATVLPDPAEQGRTMLLPRSQGPPPVTSAGYVQPVAGYDPGRGTAGPLPPPVPLPPIGPPPGG
jgi:hypothetical protein